MTPETLLLNLTWFLPLAVGLLALPIRLPKLGLLVAMLTAVPAVLTALFVPVGTMSAQSAFLLGSQFLLDDVGRSFLLFTAVLWLLAGLFSLGYMRQDEGQSRFVAYYLLAMAGNFGLILTNDIPGFYLWFALMSFASYGLVLHTGDAEARRAGRVYMILVIVGEVLLFAALVSLYYVGGMLPLLEALDPNDFSNLDKILFPREPLLLLNELGAGIFSTLSNTLIFISFGLKAGVVGLHVWLPLAHPAAPVPASAVLSGAMIKAGVLGWIRFLEPANADLGQLIILLGITTAFYGAVMGVSQVNPKTVLAYSSISQMGFIMVGVGMWVWLGDGGLAALTAVSLYAIHHALAKGALFLGVAFMGSGPRPVLLLLLPALALAGLPLTSGAIAKTSLKATTELLPTAWKSGLEWPLALGAVGTTLLMVRFLWLLWHAPQKEKKVPLLMWGTWGALLLLVAGLLFLWPAAHTAVVESLAPDKWWSASWPILLGLALSGMAARWWPAERTLPLVPPGDVLLPLSGALTFLQRGALGIVAGLGEIEAAFKRQIATLHHPSSQLVALFTRGEIALRRDWLVPGAIILLMALGILSMLWLGG